MPSVIRISCTVISVVETFFSPASSCRESFGKNASQETNSAPVAAIFSLNSLNE